MRLIQDEQTNQLTTAAMKQEKKKGSIISSWMKKYFGTTESSTKKVSSEQQHRKGSSNYLPPILAPDANYASQSAYSNNSLSKASHTNTLASTKSSTKSMVFREKPPRTPLPIPQQTITIPGKLIAPPPRQIIIEQEEEYDENEPPHEIIIERWLAYPKQQRKVIFEKPGGAQGDYQMVTEADDDTLKSQLKRLGMSEADLQRIDWESFDANTLDPNTKRNIIYQSAPSIQPALTPRNIFIDWEYDASNVHYAEEPIDAGNTYVSSDRRSNGESRSVTYEQYAKSLVNLNGANVKFLGVEEADPHEYVRKHAAELIEPSKMPDYFKAIQVPEGLVGEKVELAADRNNRLSFDFTGDVDALNLVSDKNLYKF